MHKHIHVQAVEENQDGFTLKWTFDLDVQDRDLNCLISSIVITEIFFFFLSDRWWILRSLMMCYTYI